MEKYCIVFDSSPSSFYQYYSVTYGKSIYGKCNYGKSIYVKCNCSLCTTSHEFSQELLSLSSYYQNEEKNEQWKTKLHEMFISILLPPLNPVSLDCHWNTVIKILNQYSHTCRIDMILSICSVVSKHHSKQYIIVNLTLLSTLLWT